VTRAFAAALGVFLTVVVATATAQSSAAVAATESRRITDATGRSIALPAKVEHVLAAGPPASELIFALAPDKLIGWPRATHPDEVPFLPERAAALPAFAASVRGLPGWRDVPAVANGRVYVPPDVPFGWFDAPPSLNRLLGVQWLARILHPDLFPEPLAPRVKAFHALYYHREPTDVQVRTLLEAAGTLK